MKKIVFFSKNMNIGGMEKALVSLLNELSVFYEITLYLEEKSGPLLKQISKNVKVLEYKISACKNKLIRKTINFIKRNLFVALNYNKYYFSCNYATYSIIGSILMQRLSRNNSIYIHSNYYEMFEKDSVRTKKFFKSIYIEKFNNIIFVSNEAKNSTGFVLPEIQNKMCVINNIVDYINIKQLAEKDIKIDRNTFVYVGRMDETSKQISLLIKSFANTTGKKLVVIGDGPNLKDYKKQAGFSNSSITFLGEVENPYPYMKKCGGIVLTSKYEGFPVIYNEALVLNAPILTTIKTSDSEIDISDYAIIMNNNFEDISSKLQNFKYTSQDNQIDFKQINECRIKKIREIIEGGGK